LPASSWAYSQSGFYKCPLVFYLIPSALAPKAHPHQQEVPIDIGLPFVVLQPIFKRAEVMWLHTTSGQSPCSIGIILGPSWRCLWGHFPVERWTKACLTNKTLQLPGIQLDECWCAAQHPFYYLLWTYALLHEQGCSPKWYGINP